MNNRPLQRGDLCLIVAGKFSVQQCELVQRFEPFQKDVMLRCGRLADVVSPVPMWEVITDPTFVTVVQEYHLMRIDGNPDAETETVECDEEITA